MYIVHSLVLYKMHIVLGVHIDNAKAHTTSLDRFRHSAMHYSLSLDLSRQFH